MMHVENTRKMIEYLRTMKDRDDVPGFNMTVWCCDVDLRDDVTPTHAQAHPESSCGCLALHTVLVLGSEEQKDTFGEVDRDGAELLGLTTEQENFLFWSRDAAILDAAAMADLLEEMLAEQVKES